MSGTGLTDLDHAQSRPRAGAAVGEFVLELYQLAKHGLLHAEDTPSRPLEDIFLEVYSTMKRPVSSRLRVGILKAHIACPQ